MLEDYTKFIEKFFIDQKLYARGKDVSNIEWEMYWNIEMFGEDTPWGVKTTDSKKWVTGDSEWLLATIMFKRIDTAYIISEIEATIKSSIVVGRMLEKEAERLLGSDVVEHTIAEHKQFEEALMKVMTKHLNKDQADKNNKPDLRLV